MTLRVRGQGDEQRTSLSTPGVAGFDRGPAIPGESVPEGARNVARKCDWATTEAGPCPAFEPLQDALCNVGPRWMFEAVWASAHEWQPDQEGTPANGQD